MQATLIPPGAAGTAAPVPMEVPAALLPPPQTQQQQQRRGSSFRGRGGVRHALRPQATCEGLSGEQLYQPSFSQDPWAALP